MAMKVTPPLTINSRCDRTPSHDLSPGPASLIRRGSAGVSVLAAQKPTALVVQERDLVMLCDLFTHGAMLGEHLHALYFPGCTRRRMNQRLHQLQNAGLIVRRPLPLGLSTALPHAVVPSTPWVYGLGSVGAPLVSAHLEWDLTEVRRVVRLGSPTAVVHTLEVVRFRIQAEEAVHQRNQRNSNAKEARILKAECEGTAMQFMPERLLRHSYQVRMSGGSWRDEVYKPDALLKVAFAGGLWQHHFVETDLGHTSASEWKVKAAIAVRYGRSGLFKKRYGAETFGTLICTTGERRLTHLSRLLAQQLEAEDAARFGLTTFAEVAAKGPLAAIWQVPGTKRPLGLEEWSFNPIP